jgi:hypothetical protein
MVVTDTHLARGASNGGLSFHDRGGPYGRTKGAKRVVAVDVTGLPVGAVVVPASTHENRASDLMPEHLTRKALLVIGAGTGKAAIPYARGEACVSVVGAAKRGIPGSHVGIVGRRSRDT